LEISRPEWFWDPRSILVNEYRWGGVFLGEDVGVGWGSGRNLKLVTRFYEYLVCELRMSRAVPPRPQYALMVSTRISCFIYTDTGGKGKGKAIPLQAWTGPEGSRRLRLPDFKTVVI